MIGAIAFILALIYVPQCGVPIYVENTNALSLGLAAVIAFCAYRFK
jgi:hypothetical protein